MYSSAVFHSTMNFTTFFDALALPQCGLTLETYGGMTQSVEISALTGDDGMDGVAVVIGVV